MQLWLILYQKNEDNKLPNTYEKYIIQCAPPKEYTKAQIDLFIKENCPPRNKMHDYVEPKTGQLIANYHDIAYKTRFDKFYVKKNKIK